MDYRSILRPVHPDDLQIIEDMWRDATLEGREKTFEYRVRRVSDGMYRWHRGFHRPERDGGRTIVRWVGCGFDVHDLRTAREDLGIMAERQKLAIDAGGVGLWDWEIDNDRLNWSEHLYELHGLTPESVKGTLKAFTDLIHIDDAARVSAAIQDALKTGRLDGSEFRIVRPSGEIRWISMRARVVCHPSGHAVRLLGASIDITERKTAETRLSRQVEEFETLFRELPVGVGVAYDRRCEVVRINPAFAKMLGIQADSNASKNTPHGDNLGFRVMQGDNEVSPEDLPMQVAARTGREVRNFTYELVRSDGSRVEEYGNAVPITDEAGNVTGSIGVFIDIAELQRMHQNDGQ